MAHHVPHLGAARRQRRVIAAAVLCLAVLGGTTACGEEGNDPQLPGSADQEAVSASPIRASELDCELAASAEFDYEATTAAPEGPMPIRPSPSHGFRKARG